MTTLSGVVATVGATWYSVNRTEQIAITAELERGRAIRGNAIAIVEEHVINEKAMDIRRLARLIERRKHELSVGVPISVVEVIEGAEFNILNTRYLDFAKKNQFKSTFDQLYASLAPGDFTPVENVPHAALLNELAIAIQEGKPTEALQKVSQLVAEYEAEAAPVKGVTRPKVSLTESLRTLYRKDPIALAGIMLGLATYGWLFSRPRFRRALLRVVGRLTE